MKNPLLKLLSVLIYFIIANSGYAQKVSAYQAGVYQPGIFNLRDWSTIDALGLLFMDYNYWNKSNSYIDQYGNKVSSLKINGSTLDLSTQISGYTNVPVIFYASNLKILKGRYMASINPIFVSSNYKSNIHYCTHWQNPTNLYLNQSFEKNAIISSCNFTIIFDLFQNKVKQFFNKKNIKIFVFKTNRHIFVSKYLHT